jgi:spore germination protein GerM
MRPVRALTAVALAGLVVATAGCGLSTNDKPESINDTTVDPTTRGSTAYTPPSDDTGLVTTWFLNTDRKGAYLVSQPRRVALPVTPARRIEALLQQPPDDAERGRGIWSAIPADATLQSPPVRRGKVLVIAMPDRVYEQLHGKVAQGAFAQLVYTGAAVPGIAAVQFTRDGAVFPAVDGSGQARTDPLAPADFSDFDRTWRRSGRLRRSSDPPEQRRISK